MILPPLPLPPTALHAPAVITGEFVHVAGTRRYRLFLPDSARSPVRALVVMLHGCGQSGEELARLSRMDQAAERGGFAVLYPEQSPSANPLRCWNWFAPEHQRRDAGEPAIIAALTRKVIADHKLDSTRVHVAGISAGGAMAATLAVAYPELVAGLALHSAVPYRSAATVPRAMAVMRGDPPDSVTIAHDMGARRRDIPVIVVQGSVDPVVNVRNGEAIVAQWRRANASAPTEYRLVEGLAHAWSGGAAGEKYADPTGPDATALFVEFFTRHGSLSRAGGGRQP